MATTITINNYTYTLDDSNYTCSVVCGSTTDTTVSGLFDSVLYNGHFYKLTSVKNCYSSLTNLTYPPRIPSTVTNMEGCFNGCTKLKFPPKLPPQVTTLKSCFSGCTSLFVPSSFIIPSTVTTMNNCFDGCTSMTKIPTILGENVQMDYAFRNTKITDFRGLPRIYNNYMYATAGSNSSIVYGSEELNYQAIEYSGMNTTSSSSPYYNSTISTWPKFTTVSGTMSIKALFGKLIDKVNSLKTNCSTLLSCCEYLDELALSSYTMYLLNLSIYSSALRLKIPYYMSSCFSKYRHYTLTDNTGGANVYHLRTSDGFCVTRSIHSPNPAPTTSRAGRTSSYTFYNTTGASYTSSASLFDGTSSVWKDRGIIKHMRVGSTGVHLITLNGTAAQSGTTITYTYESWGNTSGTLTDTLVAEIFLQGIESIDYTYNQVSWS